MPDDRYPLAGPLRRLGIFLVAAAVVLTLGGLWFLRRLPPPAADRAAPNPAASTKPLPAASPAPSPTADLKSQISNPPSPAPDASPLNADVLRTIEQCLAVLRDPANPDKRAALAALRAALDRAGANAADAPAAIAALREFLARGEDAATGERFRVAAGGALSEAPTLRTLLMDRLGSLARTAGTDDAALVARETLGRKDSADEWALALRNLAWADPEGSRSFLAARTREMLAYEPWRTSPTGGYLEAFDAAAYSRDASLMGDLAALGTQPGSTRRAALVGADRLAAAAPLAVADYLNANPGVLADRPLLRADYMGKLDLADPAQRAQAETYLDRADISLAEKTKFLGRLETPAGFASESLLTDALPINGSLIDRRAAVNRAAAEWLNANRFPALQTPLADLVSYTR